MRRFLEFAALAAGALTFLLGAWSCQSSAVPGAVSETHEESDRYPADLGPGEVDVARYPRARREDYGLFVERCSGCHNLARTINSPIKDSATWTRYVNRMHVKNEAETGKPLLSGAEARRIVAFLVFDSRERKLKDVDRFEALQKELQSRFDREELSRSRGTVEVERPRAGEVQ